MTERHKDDLVQGWLRKADSDLAALALALQAGVALDTACFHAQQGAEKFLKAYLLAHGIQFPFTHNLARLVILCQAHEPVFASLIDLANALTPYAVELRYDGDFWPELETAREAQAAVLVIKAFVLARLPDRSDDTEDIGAGL